MKQLICGSLSGMRTRQSLPQPYISWKETTFMLDSPWGREATGKKEACVCAHRVTSVVSDSLRPCRLWPARLLCQGGGLQARILEHIDQSWLPSPSRTLYFLLPEPPTPLSAWCCLSPCDPSSCPTSTPGLTGANPSPPGQPQGQTPVHDPHAEVEIKPQLRPRGGVAEEEDPTFPPATQAAD